MDWAGIGLWSAIVLAAWWWGTRTEGQSYKPRHNRARR